MNIIIILIFVLLLMVMKRPFCRTIKGKKRCTKIKPQMNARDIITIQMNALKNNTKDSGIRSAFKYASPENKKNTGPYPRFKKMVQSETYKHLLNCKRWKFLPRTTKKINDEIYSTDIEVLSSHDKKKYIYTFTLSRQIRSLFWRTESVTLKNMKEMKNRSKNVFNKELQSCSFDPITGWHRGGYCTTDDMDHGTHTVCSEVNDDFLNYTKGKGNDLSTPRNNFPGLKPGDKWCLCANRWLEAYKDGHAPPVILESTHKKTIDEFIPFDILKKYKH